MTRLESEKYVLSFTDILSAVHGSYTTASLNRAAKMSGAVGDALSRISLKNLAEEGDKYSRSKDYDYSEDVRVFIKEIAATADLFAEKGRTLKGLSPRDFGVLSVERGETLKAKLVNLNREYSRQKNPWFL